MNESRGSKSGTAREPLAITSSEVLSRADRTECLKSSQQDTDIDGNCKVYKGKTHWKIT